MAAANTDFSVELFSDADSDGWVVVQREAGLPRRVIAAYLTRAKAEEAAKRFRKEARRSTRPRRSNGPLQPG